MITLLLIDDHEIFRDGIKSYLANQHIFEIMYEAGDLPSAKKIIEHHQPNIIILDLSLGNKSGIDILKFVKENNFVSKCLVLSMHDDNAYINQCLSLNAAGYILKNESGTELLKAIQFILKGETYISHGVSKNLLKNYHPKNNLKQPGFESSKLTTREEEIILLIEKGLTTQQIASKLFISTKTVETHRSNLFKKLEVTNAIELLNKARALGILD
ncbi:MAG: response regulator transcription factor [Cyclobacteriaceae bacterium]|jgi:two-component system response regulator NreC|nr:response regulator transcription factor [Cyclobacteriaceae bacterium]